MPRDPRPDKSNNLSERSQGAYRLARAKREKKAQGKQTLSRWR